MALKDLSCYSTNECLRVQMDGKKACDNCDLYGTDRCGGQEILLTGKNKRGYAVTDSGLSNDAPQAGQIGKAKKRKNKK